jgi:hypothetical protein
LEARGLTLDSASNRLVSLIFTGQSGRHVLRGLLEKGFIELGSPNEGEIRALCDALVATEGRLRPLKQISCVVWKTRLRGRLLLECLNLKRADSDGMLIGPSPRR